MDNIVYTKENCKFCEKAKARLKEEGIEFEEKVLGTDFNRDQYFDIVPLGHTTYPGIFIDGVFIGGHTELVKYLR